MGSSMRAASTSTSTAPRPAVDELVRYRHDLAAADAVESAVRAEGSIPTQGGGTRVIALSSHAQQTVEARS